MGKKVSNNVEEEDQDESESEPNWKWTNIKMKVDQPESEKNENEQKSYKYWKLKEDQFHLNIDKNVKEENGEEFVEIAWRSEWWPLLGWECRLLGLFLWFRKKGLSKFKCNCKSTRLGERFTTIIREESRMCVFFCWNTN